MTEWKTPAPLYRDPVFDGAADPVVIYNYQEQCWWMLYTQRRASLPVVGVSGSFGTAIGIASSGDKGKTWVYRGVCEGLSIDRGHNTFWAPEVFFDSNTGLYHMIVTYIRGIPHRWSLSSHGRNGMVHYVSNNLWDWQYQNFIFDLEHSDIIDACVFPLPEGGWRMWYRDTAKGCDILYADTSDFKSFAKPALAVAGHAEGPNVFALGGYNWLVTDPLGQRQGLAVYRSRTLGDWMRMDNILAQDGVRTFDNSKGRHADIVVQGDRGYIFYFTQPYKDYSAKRSFDEIQGQDAICMVQCGLLQVNQGVLCCDRNENFEISLITPAE